MHSAHVQTVTSSHLQSLYPTLKEVQKFQIKFWHSNNSDWSFNMGVCEKFFWYYFELFRELSNT